MPVGNLSANVFGDPTGLLQCPLLVVQRVQRRLLAAQGRVKVSLRRSMGLSIISIILIEFAFATRLECACWVSLGG